MSIIHGDAFNELPKLAGIGAGMVFTDPPYSSGGLFRDDRAVDPADKYVQHGVHRKRPSFSGDNKDQRAYTSWTAEWMRLAAAALRPGGYLLCWTDWRQLPATTDALQWAGLIWRGILTWDKGPAARAPHKGYYKHQCEYVVWGTKGKVAQLLHDGPFLGSVTHHQPPAEKRHMTMKPPKVLGEWMRPLQAGELIIDPFAGSGSAGVAAARRGLEFIGIELDVQNATGGNAWIAETLQASGRGEATQLQLN